ncbi:MAG: acyltransferase [Nevskia sp.]
MSSPSAAPAAPIPANNFNLLRLGFATLVVFSHCFEVVDRSTRYEPFNLLFHTLSLGDLSVDGFFLLSGYLILHSWQRDPKFPAFMARRILRIYPGFIVATLIGGLLVAPYFAASSAGYWAAFQPGRFVSWMLALTEPAVPPSFAGLPYPDLNGAMWTIQYEFLCYLLVGVLGLLGLAGSRPLWLALFAAVIVASYFPDQFIALRGVPPDVRLMICDEPASFVRFLSYFSAGALYYLYRDRIRLDGRAAAVLALVCFAAMFSQNSIRLLLPTAGAYLLFWLAFAPLPDNPLSRFCAKQDLSYGVYLYGWPGQQSLLFFLRPISPYLLFVPAAALALVCGGLSWKLVEQRCLRLKPGGRRG